MTNEAAAQHQRIAIAQVLSKSDKFSTGEELAQAVLLTYDAMIIDADKRTPVQKVIVSSFIQEVARQKKAA
jgi:ABC-type oligopeptide transport system ATPase subunit